MAAARTKYQKIHSADSFDTESIKEELYNARKLKLESKLVNLNIDPRLIHNTDIHTISTKLVKISRML